MGKVIIAYIFVIVNYLRKNKKKIIINIDGNFLSDYYHLISMEKVQQVFCAVVKHIWM